MELKPRATTDILFFDTESTGIPHFKLPSDDESQPRIVELCGLRYSENGELVGKVAMIVKPEGWEIPQETIDVHGITNEHATAHGSPEVFVLAAFMALYEGCALRVGHNRNFDDRIVRTALMRHAGRDQADAFKALPGECTAMLARPLCMLPATEAMKKTNFKNSFKTPTLAEALLCLTGNELVGAHTAEADAQACARIYFAIKGVRMPEFPTDIDKLEALPDEAQQCDAEPLLANETAAE